MKPRPPRQVSLSARSRRYWRQKRACVSRTAHACAQRAGPAASGLWDHDIETTSHLAPRLLPFLSELDRCHRSGWIACAPPANYNGLRVPGCIFCCTSSLVFGGAREAIFPLIVRRRLGAKLHGAGLQASACRLRSRAWQAHSVGVVWCWPAASAKASGMPRGRRRRNSSGYRPTAAIFRELRVVARRCRQLSGIRSAVAMPMFDRPNRPDRPDRMVT
jgi:hypothetical protein